MRSVYRTQVPGLGNRHPADAVNPRSYTLAGCVLFEYVESLRHEIPLDARTLVLLEDAEFPAFVHALIAQDVRCKRGSAARR